MKRTCEGIKQVSRRLTTATESTGYTCGLDVEPLHRYRPGGYHPIHIGDTLDGRYKILHKLGWCSFSTVWTAQDLRKQRCFALKVAIAEKEGDGRELSVVKAIGSYNPDHPGFGHVLSTHEHFQIRGPNGTHDCFVLAIAGSSIPESRENSFRGKRLPARLARSLSKQIALGLAYLHEQGITHADLHTGNIILSSASTRKLSDPAWWTTRYAETEPVKRKDSQSLGPNVPRYLVWPISLPFESSSQWSAKIADFGEAFVPGAKARQLHTPLVVRPPEAIFNDRIDIRADLWSLGCMLFELVTGQPPFDSIMITPVNMVEQMLETTGEILPEKWQSRWSTMSKSEHFSKAGIRLQEWLEEVYFEEKGKPEFSREDIQNLGRIIRSLLRLEPRQRVSAKGIAEDYWLKDAYR